VCLDGGFKRGNDMKVYFSYLNYRHYKMIFRNYLIINMINDHIILQKYLIYFKKTFNIVRNLKIKVSFSLPSTTKHSIQTHS